MFTLVKYQNVQTHYVANKITKEILILNKKIIEDYNKDFLKDHLEKL